MSVAFFGSEGRTTATVAADGTATATIKPTSIRPWRVTQVSAEMPAAPSGAICSLRKNGVFVTAMIPSGDVAAGEPPVMVRSGDRLTVEWESCTPGDVATVLYFFDQLER